MVGLPLPLADFHQFPGRLSHRSGIESRGTKRVPEAVTHPELGCESGDSGILQVLWILRRIVRRSRTSPGFAAEYFDPTYYSPDRYQFLHIPDPELLD